MIKYIFGLFIILGLVLAGWLYNLYDEIKHDVDIVVNYSPKQSTQFFDKNGKIIANTFKEENREYVKYDDIPARIIEGLVAIEDTQFFEHHGINPDAISRAIIKDIKAGGFVEGASTLTHESRNRSGYPGGRCVISSERKSRAVFYYQCTCNIYTGT